MPYAKLEQLQNELAELRELVLALPAVQVIIVDKQRAADRARRAALAQQALTTPAVLADLADDELRQTLEHADPVAVAVAAASTAPEVHAKIMARLGPAQRDRVALALLSDDDLPRVVYLLAAPPRARNGGTRTWSAQFSPQAITSATAARLRAVGLGHMVATGAHANQLCPPSWGGAGDRAAMPSREAVDLIGEVVPAIAVAIAEGDLMIVEATIDERRAAWLQACR